MFTHYLSSRRSVMMFGALLIGLVGAAAIGTGHQGSHLAAPEVLACLRQTDSDDAPGGEILYADWTDTDADGNEIAAGKWSVDLEAGYDVDGDNLVDRTEAFSFGTSDRMDSRSMSTSDLDIPFEELLIRADTDGDGSPDQEVEPSKATVKAKGLDPTNGPQDNGFSEEVRCSLWAKPE